jgi:hypothetical protein
MPTQSRSVQNIVVNKRSGMHEFEGGGGLNVLFGNISDNFSRQKQQGGAQPLPADPQTILDDLIDKRIGMRQRLTHQCFHCGHIVCNESVCVFGHAMEIREIVPVIYRKKGKRQGIVSRLQRDDLIGANINACSTFGTRVIDNRFAIFNGNRIEGTCRNTFTAAGAFIFIYFYCH